MAGKRVFTPFAEYYQKYVDTAIQDVVTGGTDYNSAIRKVVTQMTNSGLRVVDYASGHTNRADVAARRAVLTGVNQITAQVSEHNAEKLDTEYFEVSWHPCARPDHQTWQGRVFSKKELGTVCGYGTVTGLCGANCRHTFHPFIPGVSERLYPDDWLEEQNKREAQTKEWNGKQLNAYEQTQQQRKMETAMRAQRQKIRLLEEAGADKDDIMLEKAKYQGQLNEYKQFSKKMGLVEQRERIYQDGLGKVATNTKQQNARYTPEMIRNAKIDSNQYKRYKEVLKEDAGSLADFRQMKYNDPEKWDELQHRYSVVRLYDVDSGEMSPSKIDELDQKAFQTKTELFTELQKEKVILQLWNLTALQSLEIVSWMKKEIQHIPILKETKQLLFYKQNRLNLKQRLWEIMTDLVIVKRNCLNMQHQLQEMEKNIHLTCCQNAVCAKAVEELCSSLKRTFQMSR